MAVGFSAGSESHTSTTGSASEASFSWTHTQTGVPAGVLVFVCTNANAKDATSVTYGTDTVPAVSSGSVTWTGTEPRSVQAFFLGSTALSGNQTVTVNRNNNANVMYAVCFTVTATGTTEVAPGFVTEAADDVLAEVNVDDGSLSGTASMRFAFVNSALNSVPSAGSNTTINTGWSIDFGTNIARAGRETTAGIGSRPVGFSSGTSDDKAAIYLAVREASRAKAPAVGSIVAAGGTPAVGQTYTAQPGVGSVVVAGLAPTVPAPRDVRVSWAQLIVPSAGVENTNYSPAVGAVVAAGLAPTIRRDVICAPGVGSVAAAGLAPTVRRDAIAYPAVGAVVAAGLAPAVFLNAICYPGVGSVVASGAAPSTLADARITPAVGSVLAAGLAPSTLTDVRVVPGVGSIVAQGFAPVAQRADSVFPGAGTVVMAGQAPTTGATESYNISVGVGTLVAAGFAPSADRTANQVAAPPLGAAVYSGLAPTLTQTDHRYGYPTAGSVAVIGLAPLAQTSGNFVAYPGVGSVDATGLTPATSQSDLRLAAPGSGVIAVAGLVPAVQLSSARYVLVSWAQLIAPAAQIASAQPAAGSVTVSGLVPVVQKTAHAVAAPTAGAIVTAGHAPTVQQTGDAVASPGVGSMVAAGGTPTLQFSGRTVVVSWAQLVLPAAPDNSVTAYPGIGAVTFAGRPPDVQSAGARDVRVSWAQLVVPMAAANSAVYPAVGSVAVQGGAPVEGHYGIDVSWDDAGADEGYRVKWGTASGVYTSSIDVGADVLTAFISGLVYGQTYYVAVAALVGGVEQDLSDELVLTIGFGPTPAVGSVAVSGCVPTVQVSASAALQPAAGSVTVVGLAPTVQASNLVTKAPAVGAIVAAGFAPTVQTADNHVCSPGAGAVALAGGTPYLTAGDSRLAFPAAGSIVAAGLAPTIQATSNALCYPAVGSVALVGAAPQPLQDLRVAPAVGSAVFSGAAPSLLTDRRAQPGAGAIVASGLAPTCAATAHHVVGVPAGMVVASGLLPEASTAGLRSPGVGAVALEGLAPIAAQGQSAWAGAASVEVSGFAPALYQTGNVEVAPPAGVLEAAGGAVAARVSFLSVVPGTSRPPPGTGLDQRLRPRALSLVAQYGKSVVLRSLLAPGEYDPGTGGSRRNYANYEAKGTVSAAMRFTFDAALARKADTALLLPDEGLQVKPKPGDVVDLRDGTSLWSVLAVQSIYSGELPAVHILLLHRAGTPASMAYRTTPTSPTALDQRLRPRAAALLAKYGKGVLLQTERTGEYDPETGAAPTHPVNREVKAVLQQPAKIMFDLNIARQGDTMLLLADYGLDAAPKPGDAVDMRDGEPSWTAVAVQTTYTGEQAAVHSLLLRR